MLTRPEIKEKFLSAGNEVVANSPEEAGAWLQSEIVKWGKLIKETGIRADQVCNQGPILFAVSALSQ